MLLHIVADDFWLGRAGVTDHRKCTEMERDCFYYYFTAVIVISMIIAFNFYYCYYYMHASSPEICARGIVRHQRLQCPAVLPQQGFRV